MARVYQITEEEMLSLIDSLELHKLRHDNICNPGRELTPEDQQKLAPAIDSLHRGFHFVTVRWAQKMGFSALRN